MENPIIVPFDLNTARKIKSGEIEGSVFHRFIVFLPKKSTIGSKNPIMGILEENRTFISSRPGCILCRLDEMESWAYLDDLLP